MATVGEVTGLVVLAKKDPGNRLPELRRTLRDFPARPTGERLLNAMASAASSESSRPSSKSSDRYLPATLRWLNEEQRELRKTNDAADHHDNTQADQRDQGIYKQTARPA